MKATTKLLLFTLLLGFIINLPLRANDIRQAKVQDDKNCVTNHNNERKPRAPFSLQDFKVHLMAYISKSASLTPEESKNFFPLFFEMREKCRSIEQQKVRTLRNATQPNMSERDCQHALALIAELNTKATRIEKQYMERLRKIIGAKKLIKAINADHDFGRNFFKRMTKAR